MELGMLDNHFALESSVHENRTIVIFSLLRSTWKERWENNHIKTSTACAMLFFFLVQGKWATITNIKGHSELMLLVMKIKEVALSHVAGGLQVEPAFPSSSLPFSFSFPFLPWLGFENVELPIMSCRISLFLHIF
ncbi:hypothetical protein V6N13_032914 [Hibiscus sabdariffa]|uniref:Uncharacterized protein n=1 Tax=Hibiscus sabdariffa TaxID=183260 RepID=A0ABR2FBT0_9ROSI